MPIRLAHWLQGIWIGISKMFHKLEAEEQKLIPVAIAVVNKIKEITDSHIGDVITTIIPGNLDDKIVAKLREVLPSVILKLNIIEAIGNITDENEKLKAILAAINLSADETKNIFYHGLASLILQLISDGKLSWSDATAIAEYYYRHEMNQTQAPAQAA